MAASKFWRCDLQLWGLGHVTPSLSARVLICTAHFRAPLGGGWWAHSHQASDAPILMGSPSEALRRCSYVPWRSSEQSSPGGWEVGGGGWRLPGGRRGRVTSRQVVSSQAGTRQAGAPPAPRTPVPPQAFPCADTGLVGAGLVGLEAATAQCILLSSLEASRPRLGPVLCPRPVGASLAFLTDALRAGAPWYFCVPPEAWASPALPEGGLPPGGRACCPAEPRRCSPSEGELREQKSGCRGRGERGAASPQPASRARSERISC